MYYQDVLEAREEKDVPHSADPSNFERSAARSLNAPLAYLIAPSYSAMHFLDERAWPFLPSSLKVFGKKAIFGTGSADLSNFYTQDKNHKDVGS